MEDDSLKNHIFVFHYYNLYKCHKWSDVGVQRKSSNSGWSYMIPLIIVFSNYQNE